MTAKGRLQVCHPSVFIAKSRILGLNLMGLTVFGPVRMVPIWTRKWENIFQLEKSRGILNRFEKSWNLTQNTGKLREFYPVFIFSLIFHTGVGWVMQGCGGSCREWGGSCRGGVGHAGVWLVTQGWGGVGWHVSCISGMGNVGVGLCHVGVGMGWVM